MGTPRIWWYPAGSSGYETLALPRISDCIIDEYRVRQDAEPIGGVPVAADLGSYRGVRIVIERLSVAAAAVNRLRSLDSHLRAGYPIAFTVDSEKAAAGWSLSDLSPRSTSVTLNTFSPFPFVTGAFATDDLVSVETCSNPSHRRHITQLANVSGTTCTFDDVVPYGMSGPIFVRHDLFFPVLIMSAAVARDRQWLTSDHRRNWTMDLQLTEYPAAYGLLASTFQELAESEQGGLRTGGRTIDELLREQRNTGLGGDVTVASDLMSMPGMEIAMHVRDLIGRS